jgi:ATP-dependent DNA helicase RecQ
MRNQITAANRLGIKAVTINSTNKDQWASTNSAIRKGLVDALLISPERLANDQFIEEVLLPISSSIGLMVVDEAHCISDWGHDFRPDYRRIVNVLRQMPAGIPVLATTATANDRVVQDVSDQLGEIDVLRGSLVRKSLALQAIRLPDQAARLAWLAEQVPDLLGTGIIYTLTKRDADQVSSWLCDNGIQAAPYYSDVVHPGFADSDSYRCALEDQLLNNELKAVVATSALGMGFDKPDLGFVIHYQAPNSVVTYYQQVGRAGRAIDHAHGVLLSGREDQEIQEYFRRTAFPDESHVQTILGTLETKDGLSSLALQGEVNLTHGQIERVLKLLSVENPAPVIKNGSQWHRTTADFEMDHERIAFLTQQREREWDEMMQYIEDNGCLMTYLQQALDDEDNSPCGKCITCTPQVALSVGFSHELGVRAAEFLRQSELPLNPKKLVPKGAFPTYGFCGNLGRKGLGAERGRILSRWADAGWGKVVESGKHGGQFEDRLVEALVTMVRTTWQPVPPPTWVACVPSLQHAVLVPDFARRVADNLKLPFLDVVKKIRQNEPQKCMNNSYHQCRNLDGVFAVRGDIPSGPVLLIDDIVDSTWTLTIIAALLLDAGSGAVHPVTLATTSSS